MKRFIYLLIILLLLVGCNNEESPKIVHNKDILSEEIKKDPSLFEITSLPMHIDSTKYLLFPVGYAKKPERGFDIKSGSYSKNYSTQFARISRDVISGEFSNLKFQHIEENSFRSLTQDQISIHSITFLRDIFQNLKKQFLLYEIIDADTNRDGKLGDDDVKSLFISEIDGSNLTKLSVTNQEFVDWKIISAKNRLYFRTIEDSNKDGVFNEEDALNYFHLDFNNAELKVQEYHPL